MRLKYLVALMLALASPVMAQDTAISAADTAIALPDTVPVAGDTVYIADGEEVPADTVAAPPADLPDSFGGFLLNYFNQIMLLLSAGIMWLLVKFTKFDVAKDLVKWGVYGGSLLLTYFLVRVFAGTVPPGLSGMLGTFIDGIIPMLITALGGVSLYGMTVSQKKMVDESRPSK